MKEIKLDCFLQKEDCQIISPVIKFEISNPFEKEYILEIYNHSTNNCNLFLEAKNPAQDKSVSQINLIIISEEKLVFQGSLENFFKQKVDLASINENSIRKYFFNFDFTNLFFNNEKIALNFDFLFNFDCQGVQKNLLTKQSTTELLQNNSTQSAVLAAISSNATDNAKNLDLAKVSFWRLPVFYLLSSLFLVGFFVIIKFVHGKKKNKA